MKSHFFSDLFPVIMDEVPEGTLHVLRKKKNKTVLTKQIWVMRCDWWARVSSEIGTNQRTQPTATRRVTLTTSAKLGGYEYRICR